MLLLSPPFDSNGSGGTERISNWPNVAQLVSPALRCRDGASDLGSIIVCYFKVLSFEAICDTAADN